MKKKLSSVLAGVMALTMAVNLLTGILSTTAYAASSSEIRKQINQLKKEKEEIKGKIQEVQEQYEENEDEMKDIIARKNVIDQEVQLLTTEISNINDQISAFNVLIADKQDELWTMRRNDITSSTRIISSASAPWRRKVRFPTGKSCLRPEAFPTFWTG